MRLGGILADDMGLGKTLQTLTWLSWLKERQGRQAKPALVICPASVLHNWRREAERFVPGMKVLVLQSGQARHNLRKQIPQHDLIVTNYALLRRDLEELQKFAFRAFILDEAQFIKNPGAQVTHSVKQLKSEHRLALTGTPLENRLLDLWSIADFIQPGYLGSQEQFTEIYEPRGEGAESAQRIARRRLSSKLRPLLLRRLKKHVAKDLPDRIEQRRDCQLDEDQRKLYLAELRRSREQVMKTVAEKGLASHKERDDVLSGVEVAEAQVQSAEATLRTAELNLSYTKVRAPIAGITSREARSEGSLITADTESSLLTRIVQLQPLYVEFAAPEQEAAAVRAATPRCPPPPRRTGRGASGTAAVRSAASSADTCVAPARPSAATS
jgi:SNF2 family DNA or RNA helicase